MEHYRMVDANPHKLMAAEFLIANMPAHYSYADSSIYGYYRYAVSILSDTALTPEQQRDSLLFCTLSNYANISEKTAPDAKIVRPEILINNIDKSYAQWTTCPWSSQLTFDEYLEWLLPYKAVELQELDSWRDTLSEYFGTRIVSMIHNDVEYNTTVKVADIVRNETLNKIQRYGLYSRSGLPLLSSELLPMQRFGNISDYTLLATLVFRSLGIPAIIDETPVGSRGTAASCWYVILSDWGREMPSEWDLSTIPGWGFFPYERGPKVYRKTYAVNRERLEYFKKSKYTYPFELARKDVTDKYFLTSELNLPVDKMYRKIIKDKYVYIASAVRKDELAVADKNSRAVPDGWKIVDFGKLSKGHASFSKMGREVIYVVFGYDGKNLIPITRPFILHKDGRIEYIDSVDLNDSEYDLYKNNYN
ncbi:MAG: hypothetical protein ACOX32_04420 [Bacteroidaceae bacterium]